MIEEARTATVGVWELAGAIVFLVSGFALIGKRMWDRDERSFSTLVATNETQNKALQSTATSLASTAETLERFDHRLARIERKLGIEGD